MHVRLTLLSVVFAALVLAPTASATVDAHLAGGILTVTQGDPGTVQIVDHGSDGLEVRSWESSTTGCAPRCVGVTSIRYVGSDGDDRLFGNRSPVPIVADGGGGADNLTGGPFADLLRGGEGEDVLEDGNATQDAGDMFDGGAGIDTVAYLPYVAVESVRTGPVTVTLAEPGVTSTGNGEPGEDDHVKDVENATGGSGDDTITGNSGANVIAPGGGADVIHAGGGGDTIDARDQISDVVDCGPGVDHVRSDLKLDVAIDCDQVEPQIFGAPTLSAVPQVGVPITMVTDGVSALGDPAPTLSYRWVACGRYSCGREIGVGITFTPTEAERSYPTYGIQAEVTATNPFGSDSTRGERQLVGESPLPPAGREPGSPAGGGPAATLVPDTRGAAGVAGLPFDAALLAKRALPGRTLVRVPALDVGGLVGFRPRGKLRLSTALKPVDYVVLVCRAPARCAFTVRPVLRGRGRVVARLRRLKRSMEPGTAQVLSVTPSAALRAAVRHTRQPRLAVTLTAPESAKSAQGVASISVR